VPPTDLDRRLLAAVATGTETAAGRASAQSLLETGGVGALVDAVDAVIRREPVGHRRPA
jgi:hypothetical protein